jgi:hypothetical protein
LLARIDFNTAIVIPLLAKTLQTIDLKQLINLGTTLAITPPTPLVAPPRALKQ